MIRSVVIQGRYDGANEYIKSISLIGIIALIAEHINMTEGISKKELKDKLSTLYWSTDDCNQLITAMMCECEELDPWLPIENAPLNSRLRLFTKHDRRQVDATLYFDDDKETFTHYKLLPEDPK